MYQSRPSYVKAGRPFVGGLRAAAAAPAHAAADTYLGTFQRRVRAVLTAARQAVSTAAVMAAVQGQHASAIEDALWPAVAAVKKLGTLPYLQVMAASGNVTLAKLPKTRHAELRAAKKTVKTSSGISMSFDVQNPSAIKWAADRSASLVKDVTADQQSAIRSTVATVIEQGIAPRDAAHLLTNIVGLNEIQAGAVMNLYGRLTTANPGVAVQAGSKTIRVPVSGMSDEAIDRQIAAYSDRLLKSRSETIARTETIDSAVAGTQDAWSQAVDDGLLTGDEQQVWITTPGCCDECDFMDGQKVGLDEPFVTEDGEEVDGPTLHPRCRCDVGLA